MTAVPPTRRPSRSQPAGQHPPWTQASSARTRPGRSSAWSAWPRQTGRRRSRSRWPLWSVRSMLRIGSGHPAGERPVPAVVRRLEEHRLPELLMAAGARDLDVSHAAAACGRLPGRLAEAWCPAHLCVAGPQLVTERAGFRLVLEQRNGHLNDHCLTGGHESMTIVTCTEDRYEDPGPCRVTTQRVRCSMARMPHRLRRCSPWLNRTGAEGDLKEPNGRTPAKLTGDGHQGPQPRACRRHLTTASRPTYDATALRAAETSGEPPQKSHKSASRTRPHRYPTFQADARP
jgi:hypothetical protein